jgi:hypothetical protein
LLDQGFCFNAGEWNFPDEQLRQVENIVQRHLPRISGIARATSASFGAKGEFLIREMPGSRKEASSPGAIASLE